MYGSFAETYGSFAGIQAPCGNRALLQQYRALSRKLIALLRKYRALLQKFQAFLGIYRALLRKCGGFVEHVSCEGNSE